MGGCSFGFFGFLIGALIRLDDQEVNNAEDSGEEDEGNQSDNGNE